MARRFVTTDTQAIIEGGFKDYTLLKNLDTTNTVSLDHYATDPASWGMDLKPGASITWSPHRPCFARCATGSAQLAIVPGTYLTAPAASSTGGGGAFGALTNSGTGYYPTYSSNGTNSGALLSQNLEYMTPFYLLAPATIDRLTFFTVSYVTSDQTIRFGLRADLNGKPDALLADTGEITPVNSSSQEGTFSPVTLSAGLYWYTYVRHNNAGTFGIRGQASVGTLDFLPPTVLINCGNTLSALSYGNTPSGYSQAGITGALPASVGTLTRVATNTIAVVYYHVV